MGMAILTKLITEKFLAKILVCGMWAIAKRTKKLKVDDRLVETVAEALDVTDFK